MDLRTFYQKVREVESSIAEDPTLVTSLQTSEGGKPGIISEVTRANAARMIAEGKARLTSGEEAKVHRAHLQANLERMRRDLEARNLQVTVISEAELRRMRDGGRGTKG